MGNLFKSELYKLKKDRSFLLLTILLVIVSICYPLLIVFDEGAGLIKISDFYQSTVLNGNNYVIKLAPCILAGFFISNEYSIGTMKNIGASGNSRFRIYFAKLMVFSIGAIIISLILPIVMTGVSALYSGFHDMPELGYFVKTIGLTILYAASFSSLMALLATILTESGKAIAFMLLFFLLFDGILYGLSTLIPIFELVLKYSIFDLLLKIVNVATFMNGGMNKMIIVPIITYGIFGLLGSLIFIKKEIK